MPYIHDGPTLWLTEDQTTIVEDGDPRAAVLLVAHGGTLPDDVAAKYGIKAHYTVPNKLKTGTANKAVVEEDAPHKGGKK